MIPFPNAYEQSAPQDSGHFKNRQKQQTTEFHHDPTQLQADTNTFISRSMRLTNTSSMKVTEELRKNKYSTPSKVNRQNWTNSKKKHQRIYCETILNNYKHSGESKR